MAEVYRAKVIGSEGFEKIVAIKRILPHLAANEDFVSMFIDEAKIVSMLNHQNICPVIELGRCDDGLYIVMEYIWGRDLRQILNAMGRAGRLIPLSVAAYITSRIAEGLDYAHRRTGPTGQPLGIVHRDVSPQNVLISYEGDVKVIDFGIARASERSTQTRAGTFKGKFAYMSPEQARGKLLDRRSDIFSVGILLHEMITGNRLFAAKNDLDTLERVRNCQVPYPTRPFEQVPDELQRIVMKTLSATPEDRYQWAGEMQIDLDRFLMLSGELATASRLGTWICLNFSEHAAKALVDQERAARAKAPGAEQPQSPHASQPPQQQRPQQQKHEEYIPLGAGDASRTDEGSMSYSTTGLPEESASFVTNEADHAHRRAPEPEIEFEIDDGLFVFDEDNLFDENNQPPAEGSRPLQPDSYSRDDRRRAHPSSDHRESRPSWTGTGSVVIINDDERSHPDVRDSAIPNPQRPSNTGRYSWQGDEDRPSSQPPPESDKGIEISATVDVGNGEDLVIVEDLPPPKSGTNGNS